MPETRAYPAALISKRWFDTTTARHAARTAPLAPGDIVLSLCGESVTVTVSPPGQPAPERAARDQHRRRQDGIPTRDSHPTSPHHRDANIDPATPDRRVGAEPCRATPAHPRSAADRGRPTTRRCRRSRS